MVAPLSIRPYPEMVGDLAYEARQRFLCAFRGENQVLKLLAVRPTEGMTALSLDLGSLIPFVFGFNDLLDFG